MKNFLRSLSVENHKGPFGLPSTFASIKKLVSRGNRNTYSCFSGHVTTQKNSRINLQANTKVLFSFSPAHFSFLKKTKNNSHNLDDTETIHLILINISVWSTKKGQEMSIITLQVFSFLCVPILQSIDFHGKLGTGISCAK